MVSFDTLNLSESVLRALEVMNYEEASPIQAEAIPYALKGADVIGRAHTGTGKTAAFGIPLVEDATRGRSSLVLVPTRELAQQVAREIARIGATAGIRAIPLFGGAPIGEQVRAIRRAVERGGERDIGVVFVATPGRWRDHVGRGNVDASTLTRIVLDEADEMLNMGFLEEVEEILADLPEDRQSMLFSATMPPAVARLATRYMRDPVTVTVAASEEGVGAGSTEEFAVDARHSEKVDVLVRILAVERPTGTLVFRHTRDAVDELVQELRGRGFHAEGLHGGFQQHSRDAVLDKFRAGRISILVATNVAARGLDVDSISHVVNFDTPREAEAYVHRVGRTGRAGRSGRSFLFVTPSDRGRLRGIERETGARLQRYQVPTDEAVHAAVHAHLVEWAGEQAKDEEGLEPFMRALDVAVESGADLRALAAAALRSAARHEGLQAPSLESRRNQKASPARRDDGPRDGPSGPFVPIAINIGRNESVRPGDIVGALTNEAGLRGSDVGRVQILPRMSVAEVPADRADAIVDTFQNASIRGRSVRARLAEGWNFGPRGGGGGGSGGPGGRGGPKRPRRPMSRSA